MSRFTVEIIKSEHAEDAITGKKIEGPTAYLLEINGVMSGMALGTRADRDPVRGAFVVAVLAKLDEALKAADAS